MLELNCIYVINIPNIWISTLKHYNQLHSNFSHRNPKNIHVEIFGDKY